MPPGSVITSGATTNIIQVLIGNSGGEITVSPVNACGVGGAKKLTIPVPCSSLTSRNLITSTLNIYPNPTNSSIQLSFISVKEGIGNIQLIDIRGSILSFKNVTYGKGLNEFNLDLSPYSNGVYLVQFISNQETKSVKVIKH